MSDQDTQLEKAAQPVSPGAALARARNSQGLSIPEVAEHLKITEGYVRAIEESTFDVLPQSAFVRGYIRNYARLVGLDGENLVKDFDRLIGKDGLDTPRLQGSRKVKPLRAHSAPSLAHALALLLVVSLGGVSYYLWNYWLDAEPVADVAIVDEVSGQLPEFPETVESISRVAEPVETEALDVEETFSADLSAAVQDRPEPVEVTPEVPVAPVDVPEVVAVIEEVEVDSSAIEPGKSLVIDFSADCWVEIKDVTGAVLVSAVQRAGSSINLDVAPPVSVRFGNTHGVESIVYDGKPVSRPNSSTRVASVLLTDNGQG